MLLHVIILKKNLYQEICHNRMASHVFNTLRPYSDQHQISPCNIDAYSTPEVMGIKDMITQGEFSMILITSPRHFYKKSMGTR